MDKDLQITRWKSLKNKISKNTIEAKSHHSQKDESDQWNPAPRVSESIDIPTVCPSAPPVPLMSNMTWNMSSKLTVKSKKRFKTRREMLDLLSFIVDEYEGNVLLEDFVIFIYILCSINLVEVKNWGNYHKYEIEIMHLITFDHTYGKQIAIPLETQWRKNPVSVSSDYSVEFKLSLQITKRTGIKAVTIYNNPLHPGVEAPDLKEILELFNLDYVQLTDQSLVFMDKRYNTVSH